MKNSIKELYSQFDANQYVRIDDTSKIDLYIGKSKDKYCFVVRGKTARINFKSTGLVTLRLEIISKKEKQLVFILENNDFYDIFIKLIEDIYLVIVQKGKTSIDIAYERWCLWRGLFSYQKNNLLTEFQIQGLLGEILFMKEKLFKEFKIKKSILSWGGPEFNKKDFEINDRWYEIKTILNNKETIKISSIQQLSSNKEGYLVVVNLEKSTIQNQYSFNLNNIIEKTMEIINDSIMIEVFLKKLNNQGYDYHEEYNKYNYVLKNIVQYKVIEDFPRLTLNNLPFGIVKCEYEIDLNSIRNFIDNKNEEV